jgi:hypothetical protein
MLYENIVSLLTVERRQLGLEESMFEMPTTLPAKAEPVLERVTIRVLKSVPQFLDADMDAYGPFSENETVELPVAVAQVLVRKGAAQQE